MTAPRKEWVGGYTTIKSISLHVAHSNMERKKEGDGENPS
jgi:hypothetical protein